MDNDRKKKVEEAMRKLTATLREQCIDTQLVTVKHWNSEIAPSMSALALAIEGWPEGSPTARTYKLRTDSLA